MDPRTVSGRTTSGSTDAGEPVDRRRRVAVVGVSLMGAAAVSTAVFQTVTGTSTSLAMVPDLASVLAGTASFPTPQGPAAAALPVSAPAITDLGVPTSTAADPTTPQVDLRANRGPLPDVAAPVRPGAPASPLAAVVPPAAPKAPATSGPTGGGPSRGGPVGEGSSRPTRPGSSPGSTTPRSTTPGTTTPPVTSPGTTTPPTTSPGGTTPPTTSPGGTTTPPTPPASSGPSSPPSALPTP